MPRLFEWKCSYYNEKDRRWLYGKIKLHQRFLRFKPDAGKLAMNSLSIDLRFTTEIKRKTTSFFYNAIVVSEKGLHHHWFSSFKNAHDVLNIIEHFWRATLLGAIDTTQRIGNNRAGRQNELLDIAYDSQATLMSAATTLHNQGEQIRDAVKKMDMLHSDLEVAEHIVSDMETWFGYWKLGSHKSTIARGQEFTILVAKSQQESHTQSKLILAIGSVKIYSMQDNKELFSFDSNDLSHTIVHSPYEVTFFQRRIGKPDVKAHVVSTELPVLLKSIENIFKKGLTYEDPPLSSDDDDEIETNMVNEYLTEHAPKFENTEEFPLPSFETRNQLLDISTRQTSNEFETFGRDQVTMEKRNKVINDSDANELSGVITNMKEMALDIQREQDLQNEQLDKLGISLEKAEDKVRKDNNVIRKMLRK